MSTPLKCEGKYIFDFDPNNCCFNLDCQTCGGRIWIGPIPEDLAVGDDIGLYWDTWDKEEDIEKEKISWGFKAAKTVSEWIGEDEEAWYATNDVIEELYK